MSREIELLEKQLAFWKHHAASLSKELDATEKIANHYAQMLDKTEEELNAERVKSEGCDFCKEGNEKCGTCVKFFDYHQDGGSDRCSSEYGNEKCAYYKPVHHCSNCGAKMKGEL